MEPARVNVWSVLAGVNRCSGGGPIPIVRRHAPDRRAKRELGSLLVDLSVEPDGSYYSIYSINNGFRKRSRGISELGCLVSTPWTHKSFIDKRRLISQAGRQRLGVHLDLAVEDVRMGPQVGLQRADILPVAASHITVQRPTCFEHHGEHFGGAIDGPAGGYPVEDLRLQHVDAGVDRVAENVAPTWLLEEPLDAPVRVEDDDAELEGVVHGHQRERRDPTLFGMELD